MVLMPEDFSLLHHLCVELPADSHVPSMAMQEEGTSAGVDGEVGMSRTARTADEAERAKQTADEFTPVTYNYAFFHFIFAVASMYLAMLMTGESFCTVWGCQANNCQLV